MWSPTGLSVHLAACGLPFSVQQLISHTLRPTAQRIGPVTCMEFHPTEMLLAVGATGAGLRVLTAGSTSSAGPGCLCGFVHELLTQDVGHFI
eukprot:COSAG02_NODE_31109_length_539_cov_0.822727_1_plen_92_part_01